MKRKQIGQRQKNNGEKKIQRNEKGQRTMRREQKCTKSMKKNEAEIQKYGKE